MKTIYKYVFGRVQDKRAIDMPKGAEIILAGMQGEDVCIWAIVKPENESVQRVFRLYGTGHPMVDDSLIDHVASFFHGPFVWHLFEELK